VATVGLKQVMRGGPTGLCYIEYRFKKGNVSDWCLYKYTSV